MLDDSRLVEWWTVWASVRRTHWLFGSLEARGNEGGSLHRRKEKLLVSPSLTDEHGEGHES